MWCDLYDVQDDRTHRYMQQYDHVISLCYIVMHSDFHWLSILDIFVESGRCLSSRSSISAFPKALRLIGRRLLMLMLSDSHGISAVHRKDDTRTHFPLLFFFPCAKFQLRRESLSRPRHILGSEWVWASAPFSTRRVPSFQQISLFTIDCTPLRTRRCLSALLKRVTQPIMSICLVSRYRVTRKQR